MSLYRADPKDGICWLTGASTGIGHALALDLVRAGYTVAATARGADKLAELAQQAKAGPGRVVPFPADVTDREAMAATIAAVEAQLGPIALAIFNAGNYFPTRGDDLSVDNFVKTFEVNLFGAVNGLVPVVRAMRRHGRGHVVLVGSVSSYFGLPSASAYGASKAAINNMAQSLRHDLDKMNIRIQVMNPGFVDTPLTEKNDFAMPALMPVDRAAARMLAGIRSGGFEVTFPRRFTWLLKVIRILPQPLRHFLVNRGTGWNRRKLKPLSDPG
ncbi:MAG: SDR family NAD(P)-dependent oxidoreductase [Rhizobiaceae bacterium]